MQTINPPQCGENVNHYALYLAWTANETRERAENVFNGTEIYAIPGDTSEDVLNRWNATQAAEYEAYKRTPEYAESQRKETNRVASLKDRINGYIIEMDSLNWKDYKTVLLFVEKTVSDLDSYEADSANKLFRDKLTLAGYVDNANVGANFKEDDEENFALYIIGQCLNCLNKMGAIHPMACSMVGDWRKKFGY